MCARTYVPRHAYLSIYANEKAHVAIIATWACKVFE